MVKAGMTKKPVHKSRSAGSRAAVLCFASVLAGLAATAGAAAAETSEEENVSQIPFTRIYWVFTPSPLSAARGGASGYIHLCPGYVFHRSSEGSFSVGRGYRPDISTDPNSGTNENVSGASVSRNAGRWAIEPGPNGQDLVLYNDDESRSVQRLRLQWVLDGSWRIGRTRYASERGKATCG